MPEPVAVIDGIIRHRLQREPKVARVLAASGGGTLDELVLAAYDDVPVAMHMMARYSLWAHLIKLEREARAASSGERCQPQPGGAYRFRRPEGIGHLRYGQADADQSDRADR